MQINKTTLANLYTGFRTLFFNALQANVDEVASMLAMRAPTMNSKEIWHWLGAFPGMKKLVDEIQIENLTAHDWSIVNDEWEDTIAVKQRDIENDSTGIYAPRFTIMGQVAAQHDGEMVADLLCHGFTRKCYTGKHFFDTDHEPIRGGVKFTNKGTEKFSQTAFRQARKNLRTRRNAAGRALKLGRDLVLVVGAENEAAALETLQAERAANGKTNVDKGTARLVVWPEIDAINPQAWFLFDAAFPIKPIIIQDEKPVELLALDDPEDDHVFKRHEFLYQAYKRAGYGYGLPEVIYGSDGSA